MAVKGVGRFFAELPQKAKRHMVIPVTEHKCVLESAKALKEIGVEVTWLPVAADGIVDPLAVKAAIRDDTALVSCDAGQ